MCYFWGGLPVAFYLAMTADSEPSALILVGMYFGALFGVIAQSLLESSWREKQRLGLLPSPDNYESEIRRQLTERWREAWGAPLLLFIVGCAVVAAMVLLKND